jgi:hypothetical protein
MQFGYVLKMHRLNLFIVEYSFLRSVGKCVKLAGKSACGKKEA